MLWNCIVITYYRHCRIRPVIINISIIIIIINLLFIFVNIISVVLIYVFGLCIE